MSAAHLRARRVPLLALAALLAALIAAAGCGKSARYPGNNIGYEASDALTNWRPTSERLFNEDDTPLVRINARAADALADIIDTTEFPIGSRLHVQPLHRLGQVQDDTLFGRLVADQVASRLSTYGYRLTVALPASTDTVEADYLGDKIAYDEKLRKREEALKEAGVFGPKPKEVALPPRPAVFSGEYTLGRDVIYLTARVTRIDDQVIIASHSWTLPNNKNTRKLLPELRTQDDGMTPSTDTTLNGAPATTFQ